MTSHCFLVLCSPLGKELSLTCVKKCLFIHDKAQNSERTDSIQVQPVKAMTFIRATEEYGGLKESTVRESPTYNYILKDSYHQLFMLFGVCKNMHVYVCVCV